MIIRTLTSHNVYNYGASLQAYSLMHYLQSLGHDCQIIDYMPAYRRGRYNFWYINPASKWYWFIKIWPIRLVVCLFLAPKRFKTYKRKKAFDAFTKDKLCLTLRYNNLNELEKENWRVDAFIVGSDQVWNTDHETGRDPANYLTFVPKGSIKMSYAASFGMDKILPNYANLVKENLKVFDAVSVRENSGVTLLKDLGISATHVVDPVFLNSSAFWSSLVNTSIIPKNKYILVYDFANNSIIEKFTQYVSTQTGLTIISVNDFIEHRYTDVNVNNAGPIEFLSLIKGAEFFISNSFHGTAFSIIFHTPFFVVKRSIGNVNTRMEDLLSSLGLQDRWIENESFFHRWRERINFEEVDRLLSDRVSNSKRFLEQKL